MDIRKILAAVDHTLLAPAARWEEIRALCDDGMRYGVASVCIPASYVRPAAAYLAGRLPVCTVIGFPNGYDTTASKCFMAADAIRNGADEVDMVINIGWARDARWDALLDEIRAVRGASAGKILKVIVETCMLDREEKLRLCGIVSASGADYIKTSTGFGGGGATLEDVRLFRANSAPELKIKAAGGISGLEDAQAFLDAGADRLGTSRVVKAVKALEARAAEGAAPEK